MNENEVLKDDEISSFDLWEKLRRGWKTIIGGTVVGVAGALLAIVIVPSRYEAVAVIQVGQIGQVGQTKVSGLPVESTVQAVERMKTPAFQRRVAEALGDEEWLADIARSNLGITKNLALQVIKATAGSDVPLIELRAIGLSPEIAQKKAEAVVGQLIRAHGELAQPALTRMHADLAINRERLTNAERDLENLSTLVASATVKDDRFTQLALMTSLRIEKEAETFAHRQMILALETALGAPATKPAQTIEPIFVSDNPVSPQKTLLMALGFVGGFLLGVMAVLAADTWRRAQQSVSDRS